MSKKEYDEGKRMEDNSVLHAYLQQIFNFDKVSAHGHNRTKGDILGHKDGKTIKLTLKLGSQRNTQVHLPTLNSFAQDIGMPDDVHNTMHKWLGTVSFTEFESWLVEHNASSKERKYKRLLAPSLKDWNKVISWFNQNSEKIAKLLISSIDGEDPATYLIWINKKKGTIQILDIEKLIHYISTKCNWETGPGGGGSTIRCVTEHGKPIFHLQMKGSGGTNGEYNHNPQFHIHINWPESVVIHNNYSSIFLTE
ncbi:MAG: hypothetical protein EB127_09285 [Alphaproteobacteria bacterium]|nr:hypothetical protein [Alphaproteobacteria bacterium]